MLALQACEVQCRNKNDEFVHHTQELVHVAYIRLEPIIVTCKGQLYDIMHESLFSFYVIEGHSEH